MPKFATDKAVAMLLCVIVVQQASAESRPAPNRVSYPGYTVTQNPRVYRAVDMDLAPPLRVPERLSMREELIAGESYSQSSRRLDRAINWTHYLPQAEALSDDENGDEERGENALDRLVDDLSDLQREEGGRSEGQAEADAAAWRRGGARGGTTRKGPLDWSALTREVTVSRAVVRAERGARQAERGGGNSFSAAIRPEYGEFRSEGREFQSVERDSSAPSSATGARRSFGADAGEALYGVGDRLGGRGLDFDRPTLDAPRVSRPLSEAGSARSWGRSGGAVALPPSSGGTGAGLTGEPLRQDPGVGIRERRGMPGLE